MKSYILIAGVNGSGKSTLYQTLDHLQSMPRINMDEIVRGFGDWKNQNDIKRIAYCVSHGGHGIPDRDVERRFVESRTQLKKILP